jgi:hypothetical protein
LNFTLLPVFDSARRLNSFHEPSYVKQFLPGELPVCPVSARVTAPGTLNQWSAMARSKTSATIPQGLYLKNFIAATSASASSRL